MNDNQKPLRIKIAEGVGILLAISLVMAAVAFAVTAGVWAANWLFGGE